MRVIPGMDISQALIFLGKSLFPSYESEVVFLGFFLDIISGGVSVIGPTYNKYYYSIGGPCSGSRSSINT